MISLFRKISDHVIAKVILALIAIGFIYQGFAGFNLSSDNWVVKVGGLRMSSNEFMQAISQQVNLMRSRGDYSMTERDILSNKEQVDALINSYVVDNLYSLELANSGLEASPTKINALIRTDPVFLDDSGKFSLNKFYSYLQSLNIDEDYYKQEMKYVFLSTLMFISFNAGIDIPKGMLSNYEATTNVSYKAKEVAIDKAKLSAPNEAELRALYDKKGYSSTEYKKLEVIKIDTAAAKKVNPKETSETEIYANLVKLSRDVEDELAATTPYSETAAKFGATYLELPFLDSQIRDEQGVLYDKLPTKLLGTWLEMVLSEESEMEEQNGVFYIAKVAKNIPSKKLSFEEAKDKLLKEASAAAFEKAEQELLAANVGYNSEFSLSSIAAGAAKDVTITPKSENYARVSSTLSQGEFAFIDEKDGKKKLVKIIGVISGDEISDWAAADKAYRPEIQSALKDEFTRFLREKYSVEVNEKAIEKLRNMYDKKEE